MISTAYSRARKVAKRYGLEIIGNSGYSNRVNMCAGCNNAPCPYKGVQCWRIVTVWAKCPKKIWPEIIDVDGELETGVVL